MTSPLMVLTRILPSSFFTMSSAFLASFKMTNSLELNLSSDRFLTPSRIVGFLPGSGGKLGGRSNVTLWVPFPLGCVVAALFPLGCDAAVALLPPSSFPSLVQQLLLSLRLKPCSLFTSTSNLLTATETLLLLLLDHGKWFVQSHQYFRCKNIPRDSRKINKISSCCVRPSPTIKYASILDSGSSLLQHGLWTLTHLLYTVQHKLTLSLARMPLV